MPRLKVEEPRQQGVRTGATPAVNEVKKRKREPSETPLGADRATRGRPVDSRKRANLTPDEQAKLLVEFKELPPKKRRGSRGLRRLAKKYNVNKEYPAKLLKKIKKPAGKLPTRKGVGGRPVKITAAVEEDKSLDSRLPRVREFDLDKFEAQILEAFDQYPSDKLDALYDMKQRVCECIIACEPPGGNTFKLPHRSASEK